ncbi:MAG: monomeric [FeFe] hydrogenase [Treponema sp.]|nr:monomeric [FeFe] hydrogenase [Spirochaetia bacterium]MDY3759483.1 monomeric [FeFe] hydrogenase [Treponema sp.]MDY4130160.1 monomeric [FeFe] hydrogenase [Treponema sp.]MEE0893551.1 monomeric [FeFe] hydrogenase [Treponema sp.]
MLNINNNTANVKREILVRIAKLQLEGKLEEGVHFIPREMVPRNKPPLRCCIFHDREIIRMRTLARLGISVENIDEERTLGSFAKEALEREKPTWPMLTVIHEACNACVKAHYMVTNACQGCDARPCKMNCPRNAIIVDHHAHIDESQCINCGKCMDNCPYHAIIKIPVPCEEACPVGAISKDESGRETIDYHKCIFCGNCMRECPFGAMMGKSQLVDVIKNLMNKDKKVVALYAPAIAAQFNGIPGQVKEAFKLAGFHKVYEVALGADICADNEAKEFTERMKRGDKMMTTSCCPAYVRAIRKHVPALNDCISETRSPMHYTAEMAKKNDPDCITVFIGPCLAKRYEGFIDESVDYVLTTLDIESLFIAKEIDVSKLNGIEETMIPTASGRNFAKSGGVLDAVALRLQDKSILRPAKINGLSKSGMKVLNAYGMINSGKIPSKPDTPNLIEVMACEGGCIGGPSIIQNYKQAEIQLAKYVQTGIDKTKE